MSGDEFTAEREALVRWICARRLEVPAILFLELHKPLATLLHSLSLVSMPVLAPILGPKHWRTLLALLESQAEIEALISALEQAKIPAGAS